MKLTQQINGRVNIQIKWEKGKQQDDRNLFSSTLNVLKCLNLSTILFSTVILVHVNLLSGNFYHIFFRILQIYVSSSHITHLPTSVSFTTVFRLLSVFYCCSSIAHLLHHPCAIYLFSLERTFSLYVWKKEYIL